MVSNTDPASRFLTEEEILEAFETLGLSPGDKKPDLRTRLRSLRVAPDKKVSYKSLDDNNAGPAQER